jgi:hypothetical protein
VTQKQIVAIHRVTIFVFVVILGGRRDSNGDLLITKQQLPIDPN